MKIKEWWLCADEARMAKYWAAQEMTREICNRTINPEVIWAEYVYAIAHKFCIQFFKKEWFRK